VSLSTSVKHPHPTKPDQSVIDYTFKSRWISKKDVGYSLNLIKSLDYIYMDFCNQLSSSPVNDNIKMDEILSRNRAIDDLNREIAQLQSSIKSAKQYNRRVEMNLKLREKQAELKKIFNSPLSDRFNI
jgi:hypothetical protein